MRFYLLTLALVAPACGSSSGGGCPTTARMQAFGASCCPNFGSSACDTNLFCAALDSTTPTCQTDRSRDDLTACSDDIQCKSGSCNLLSPQIGECRSQPGTACQPAVGCAPSGGKTPICAGTPSVCQPIGNGSTGAFCGADKDCASHSCVMNKCLGDLGQPCSKSTDCANGTCMGCGFDNVRCSVSTDTQECLTDCGTDGQGNTIFSRCVSLGGACNSFNDCRSPAQCSDCSAANNTCMDPTHDLNECLDMCVSGGFSFSC